MNIFSRAIGIYNQSILSKFVFNAIGLYILWYLVYGQGNKFATWIDTQMLVHLIAISKSIVVGMGFQLFEEGPDIFGIVGSSGIMIGAPCNGISLLTLFSGFIIAFPTKFKKKIKVLVFGIVLIHLLNIVRIVSLIVLAYYHREWLEFNHDYTFTISIYFVTFIIWMYWINHLNPKNPKNV